MLYLAMPARFDLRGGRPFQGKTPSGVCRARDDGRATALRCVFFALALLVPSTGRAGSLFFDDEQLYRLDWGADAYYSFVGLNVSLIGPIEGDNILDAKEEDNVYLYLLTTFFIPRTINLELSVNPLPILGVYLKDKQRDFYDRGAIIPEINIIESITTGFPEPGAISLFVGNNAFIVNHDTGETEGIGFGGLLVSYGNYHIVSNVLVRENWLETEAKVKGITLSQTRQLSFSFRVGARFHSHPDIRNTAYVSMARSHLDRRYSGWSLLRNSDAELKAEFSQDDLSPTRFVALVGKKFPVFDGDIVLSIALGVEGLFKSGYDNTLAQRDLKPGWTLLLRPNVTF